MSMDSDGILASRHVGTIVPKQFKISTQLLVLRFLWRWSL